MGDDLDDIFADEASKKGRPKGKFLPKQKLQSQSKGSAKTSVTSSQTVQTIDSAPSELSEPADEVSKKAGPVGKFLPKNPKFRTQRKDSSKTSVTSSQIVQTIDSAPSELSEPTGTAANPSEQSSNVVPNDNADLHAVTEEPVEKNADISTGLEAPGDVLPQTMTDKGSQSVPPEIESAEMDSIPKSHLDDVLDLSSLEFTHTLPTEANSELPLNEDSMNLMEVSEMDSCIHLEDLPKVPAKLASRRAKTGTSKTHASSEPSSQQQPTQENETARSSRPRKGKGKTKLVDEDRDEECSPIVEENINNDENQVESELQMKKSKRKSKKTEIGKEKPAKKSKKVKEASEQEVAKPKKFSHSTRRRRVVDKTLLDTPEDEIDHEKVPLRDLIILAEHREREMKREGAAAGAAATNLRSENSSDPYNDEENYDEQGSPAMVDTTEYFNYQSHMDKTRTKRWSKQETELFYEAVRMFGSDLSMITVRLPGRSRREVKLKYKKEEKQHPLMLHESLANRSKDRSQFEMVVKHLRKIAAEENGDDESMDLPEEGTSNADVDGGEAKEERAEEEENDNAANDEENGNAENEEIQVKLDEVEKEEEDDGEDDYLRWTNYPSSF